MHLCKTVPVYHSGYALKGKVKMLEGKLKIFVAKRNMNENGLNIWRFLENGSGGI